MKYRIALSSRVRKLSDLWHVTFWRKVNVLEKSTDCQPQDISEKSSLDSSCEDLSWPLCDPPTLEDTLCLKPPNCYPYLCLIRKPDPRKLFLWRILSLFIALPLVLIMSLVAYIRVLEEARKPREPFLDLPYMCRRTKPFPWGDGNHTFFHNPVKNPVPPHGYEVEDPNAIYSKTVD